MKSVSEYIAGQPPTHRAALKRVRTAIRKALPAADEALSYGIPAYKIGGKVALYFAGWKTYYSIYPAKRSLVAAFKDELEPYETRGTTIRFPFARPVPTRLIERIAKYRLRELAPPAPTSKGRP